MNSSESIISSTIHEAGIKENDAEITITPKQKKAAKAENK